MTGVSEDTSKLLCRSTQSAIETKKSQRFTEHSMVLGVWCRLLRFEILSDGLQMDFSWIGISALINGLAQVRIDFPCPKNTAKAHIPNTAHLG